MTEEEKVAYLAGIIDGEGTVSINGRKSGKKGAMYYVLFVKVTNTDKRLIDWLGEEFGGVTFPVGRKNWNPRWKKAYNWEIEGRAAYKLLKRISEKMLTKKEQAETGIEFFYRCQRMVWAGGRPRPNWVKEQSAEYHRRMLKLNRRGNYDEALTS